MPESDPSRSLFILLGARVFPNYPNLPGGMAFSRSANEILDYVMDARGLGVQQRNVLDLFDDNRPAADQLRDIADFLEDRQPPESAGRGPENLFIYYVGHGLFTPSDTRYCLAIRCTDVGRLGISVMRGRDLAEVISTHASHLRRFLILDCCFAGSIVREFLSAPGETASVQMIHELPRRGTCLLCASSFDNPALAPKALGMTMFSSAFLKALRQGNPRLSHRMSMAELKHTVTEILRAEHSNWVRPELHSPDMREGEISLLPLFPNPAWTEKDSLEREQSALTGDPEKEGAQRTAETLSKAEQGREQAKTAQKAEQERKERDKARWKAEAEQIARDKETSDQKTRFEHEQAEAVRKAEQERTNREHAEAARQAERERVEREQAETARKAERERMERDRAESVGSADQKPLPPGATGTEPEAHNYSKFRLKGRTRGNLILTFAMVFVISVPIYRVCRKAQNTQPPSRLIEPDQPSRTSATGPIHKQTSTVAEKHPSSSYAPKFFFEGGDLISSPTKFLDRASSEYGQNFRSGTDFSDLKVYTRLDSNLQKIADEVISGSDNVRIILVCLDSHSSIRAIGVGDAPENIEPAFGELPSESMTLPFIYAAGFNTGPSPRSDPFTESSVLQSSESSGSQGVKSKSERTGAKSMAQTATVAFVQASTGPAVQVARIAGYEDVRNLLTQFGFKKTDSKEAFSLESYAISPIQLAAAFAALANRGAASEPPLLLSRVSSDSSLSSASKDVWHPSFKTVNLLDSQISFLTTNLLVKATHNGETYRIRHDYGIDFPLAAFAGTSTGSWIAGFTNELTCVVWVGSTASSSSRTKTHDAALRIWSGFMKRAHQQSRYRNVLDFDIPDTIVKEQVDPSTGKLATSSCPKIVANYYVPGTEPNQFCDSHKVRVNASLRSNSRATAHRDTPRTDNPSDNRTPTSLPQPAPPEKTHLVQITVTNEVDSASIVHSLASLGVNARRVPITDANGQPTSQVEILSGRMTEADAAALVSKLRGTGYPNATARRVGLFDKLKEIFK